MPGPDINLSELIRNTTTESIKANIRQLAKDLAGNRYMALAVVHAALVFYDRQLQKQHVVPELREENAAATGRRTEEHDGVAEQVDVPEASGDAASDQHARTRGEAGLHHASFEIISFLKKFERDHPWDDISKLKTLARYSSLRNIVLDQYNANTEGKRNRYFLFLAMLLIYLVDRASTEPWLTDAPSFAALKLFEVDQYLHELFSSGSKKTAVYEFPKNQVSAPDLVEVLKTELHIANPCDPRISTFFNLSSESPARYVCYRYTTQFRPRKNAQNLLTRSYTEIEPPRGGRNFYSFSHKYQDIEGSVRSTTGFVIHLDQTFYFVGGSVRGQNPAAVGVKVIAIPADEHNTWYEHEFISGLVLSNDSDLNPIAARFFMVRTGAGPQDDEELKNRFIGRIEEKEFFGDVESHAVTSRQLGKAHEREFLAALSNKIGGKGRLETPLLPFEKKNVPFKKTPVPTKGKTASSRKKSPPKKRKPARR